jgi:serine/threonine protein kinase
LIDYETSSRDSLSAKLVDVYFFYHPLTEESFVELTDSVRPLLVRQKAMQQIISGLRHLHSHGIMHRDLKPGNLMIVAYHLVHAIVIDFGSATSSRKSREHNVGTIAYLAPEVLALKAGKDDGPDYGQSVDIWGMGLVGYQLIFKQACTWRNGVKPGDWENTKAVLHGRPGVRSRLLESMLAWEPSARPTAAQIEISPAWSEEHHAELLSGHPPPRSPSSH